MFTRFVICLFDALPYVWLRCFGVFPAELEGVFNNVPYAHYYCYSGTHLVFLFFFFSLFLFLFFFFMKRDGKIKISQILLDVVLGCFFFFFT